MNSKVCAQFVQSFARYIVNGMQKFGVIGFEVVRIGSHQRSGCALFTLCDERAGVQCVVDRMARTRLVSCTIARNTRRSIKTARI